MEPNNRFPAWANRIYEEVGPVLVETDECLSSDEVVQLICEETDEVQSFAEEVYEAWYNYGRVYERSDGTVCVTEPDELDTD